MSSKKPVNIGLIGAGRIGSFHGESVQRRLVDAKLVAIADPAPGAAAKLAGTLDVDAAFTDVATMLAQPELDAVIIATPARFHTNVLVQAAEAGKHVFCEKPMALTLEDADRAIAAAKAAGVSLQVGFNRRWDQASPRVARPSTRAASARRNCCGRSSATPVRSAPIRRRCRSGPSSSKP